MADLGWVRRLSGRAFAGDVASVTPLTGGEVNEAYLVTSTAGARVVCRRAREEVADWHPTVEGQVAAMRLASEAGVPVPEVTFAEGRVLAYRYVDGAPAAPGQVTWSLARDVGRLHGLLHRRVGDGVGPVQADGSSAKWPADVAFGDVPRWVARLLADPACSGARRDVERAAAMIAAAQPKMRPRARLLHGDVSPANTILDGGTIVAVIDFDDAWFGDPAGDMAWWWWNHPSTGDDFVAGCAEVDERPGDDAVWIHRLRLLLGLADTFAATNETRAARIFSLLEGAVREATRLGLPG